MSHEEPLNELFMLKEICHCKIILLNIYNHDLVVKFYVNNFSEIFNNEADEDSVGIKEE